MRRCGPPPSDQMALPGLGAEGQALMEEARMWVEVNWDAFMWYQSEAVRLSRSSPAKISPNALKEAMRSRFRVSVKNALSPCLARIAIERRPELRGRFRLARSMADAYTTARLR